jgi:hypothetical protein
MIRPIQRFCTSLLALVFLLPLATHSQVPPPAAAYPQDQLDALLAPIALYPDQLLAQVLMASTYPLDVVSAARFVKNNPGLKGDALDNAVAAQSWDPSVQSLTAFPQVLDMMNDKLEWTRQLGDAYLADQAGVMRTVQGLRERAQAAGNLVSTQQQTVVVQDRTIIIEPAQPQTVFVPVYNPTYVYGPWWAPAFPPYFWAPPPYYYPGAAIVGGMIGFGIGWAIGSNHWGWCNTNWGGNNININVNRNNAFVNNHPNYRNSVNNGNWQHRPEQRKGVAYGNAATRDRYQRVDSNAVASRRDYRGNQPGAAAGGQRPTTMDRPGGAGGQRPTTMDRPGGIGAQGPSTMDRPGGAGGQRPTTMDRPGGTGTQPPSTMDRPGGGAQRPSNMNQPGTISASRPVDRGGVGAARPAPSFNSAQSRPQAQQYSNRGAQSRASMSTSRPSGGGGGGARAGGGGGGGGGRGGGGRGR